MFMYKTGLHNLIQGLSYLTEIESLVALLQCHSSDGTETEPSYFCEAKYNAYKWHPHQLEVIKR